MALNMSVSAGSQRPAELACRLAGDDLAPELLLTHVPILVSSLATR
jgi:hypothetical protein